MTPIAVRRVIRLLHPVAAAAVGRPVRGSTVFVARPAARAVFPALALTGLAMGLAVPLLEPVGKV